MTINIKKKFVYNRIITYTEEVTTVIKELSSVDISEGLVIKNYKNSRKQGVSVMFIRGLEGKLFAYALEEDNSNFLSLNRYDDIAWTTELIGKEIMKEDGWEVVGKFKLALEPTNEQS